MTKKEKIERFETLLESNRQVSAGTQ